VRILFSSWPGYGHLLPMVPLVRAAERAGHEVLVSSGSDLTAATGRLGLPFRSSGLTAAEGYVGVPDIGRSIDALPDKEKIAFAARYLFGPGAVARARDLGEVLEEWRPDLVVHDTFELGGPSAAEEHGVRHATHGYGPLLAENHAMVTAVATVVADAGRADPSGVFDAPYLDIAPPGLHRDEPVPWADLRPLRPSAGEADPDPALDAALDALPRARTVYLTLGTVMNQAPHVFQAALEACATLGVNVVLTTGPDTDPSSVAGNATWVLARSYVPQAVVLPRCDAVVSHAGAGTMLGALCHGVPQLCLPLGTDQPLNAAALVPTGAGLMLLPDQISAAAVADAGRRLLEDPSYADAARRLRSEIDAMPSADEVLARLV
jgi:UDP:flavonoid glycosyltransferase YjiC (YdhE family)